MPSYRLSEAAKEDLIIIARYGDENFGVVQSDHYRDQLKRRFLVIAERPLFFPAVDHIRAGYRRSVCGAHSIYYRVEVIVWKLFVLSVGKISIKIYRQCSRYSHLDKHQVALFRISN